ncbi:MAG: carbonate dehydratase [Chloroflexi bacterium]|nr:carbonate dehydratase [Chloroflexota bacterium]
MKKFIGASLVLLSLALSVRVVVADEGIHWTYEGEHGPEHWGELSHDYAACSAGREQSPISIPATASVNAANIEFNYKPTALSIVNNGHTIKVDYDAGSSMTVEGKTYNLLQFHFHALSEHTIHGNYQDGEMHLVHQSTDGQYAVVGVILSRGTENGAFAPVFTYLPLEAGDPETISGVTINAANLLPQEQSYYRYDGSFTTPPCTEGVKWFVMATPVGLSDAQFNEFEKLYSNNYRPVQPLYDRTFYSSSAAEPVPALLPATGAESVDLATFGLVLAGMASLGMGLLGYTRRRRKSV